MDGQGVDPNGPAQPKIRWQLTICHAVERVKEGIDRTLFDEIEGTRIIERAVVEVMSRQQQQ
ncbi:MAG: hypothetical protein ABII07_06110 [Patescibacteria group bacterium]|nr:hypothetical protein [Patescibacteria group bacterium]